MAKIKKDICTEICWKCGSKDLMKSNEAISQSAETETFYWTSD